MTVASLLLAVALHLVVGCKSLRSLQEWRDKQALLPQPDVLLLAMGTQVVYRAPPPLSAAAAAPPPPLWGGATTVAAAAGLYSAPCTTSGRGSGGAAAVASGWELDEQWSELLDKSYDADAARHTVDEVVRQYAAVLPPYGLHRRGHRSRWRPSFPTPPGRRSVLAPRVELVK